MISKTLAAATAIIFLSAGSFVQAQQTPPRATDAAPPSTQRQSTPPGASTNSARLDRTMLREIKDNKATVQNLNTNVKDLSDMDIYGSDGKKIGEVDKVLADSSNTVKAVTVDVGGFLGMGAREVILPLDQLKKGSEKNRLQISMTKDEIEKLDRWDNSDKGNAARNAPGANTPSRNEPSQPSR